MKTLEPLAKSGNPKAQLALAEGHLTGKGIPRDYQSALRLLELSAAQGEPDAFAHMARIYNLGLDVTADLKKGSELFARAIKLNSMRAKFMQAVGVVPQADSTEKAKVEAFAVIRAARASIPEAYLIEAYLLKEGIGGPKRQVEALKVLQVGVENGCVGCLSDLGHAYLNGEGVLKDFERAATLLQQASDQGDGRAQYSLGKLYLEGIGVAKDLVRAYAWLNLASISDTDTMLEFTRIDAAKIRDSIQESPNFSSQQLREAQKLSANWQPKSISIVFSETSTSVDSTTTDPKQRIGTGTGFFVSRDGYVLTNYHVVRSCKSVRVGQPAVAAQLVASDKVNDVSLLKVQTGPSSVATLAADGATKQGSRVVVFGYPLDGALASGGTATAGTVSALVGFGDNTSQIQITAPIQQGNSGGPVFDQYGAVIGVVVSKLDAIAIAKITGDIPQNVNFAVNARTARALLAGAKVSADTPSWWWRSKSDDQIVEDAKTFVVPIECWR